MTLSKLMSNLSITFTRNVYILLSYLKTILYTLYNYFIILSKFIIILFYFKLLIHLLLLQ